MEMVAADKIYVCRVNKALSVFLYRIISHVKLRDDNTIEYKRRRDCFLQ